MIPDVLVAQKKKLIAIGLFLIGVILLVGREDEPGMIAQIQNSQTSDQTDPQDRPPSEAVVGPNVSDETRSVPETPLLDDWYSQAGPLEASEPAPVDDSHLIDDTTPMIETGPLRVSGDEPVPVPRDMIAEKPVD